MEGRAEKYELELKRLRPLVGLLFDLDRCEHGRHEGDVCSSCGGPSKGNPIPLQASRGLFVVDTLGFNISGQPIVLPKREDNRYDVNSWRLPEHRVP